MHCRTSSCPCSRRDIISVGRGKQPTTVDVPLLPIGNIVSASQQVKPLTDQQIELVSTFADQAVIAIDVTNDWDASIVRSG